MSSKPIRDALNTEREQPEHFMRLYPFKIFLISSIGISLLTACVSAPTGPTITIMPREGKSFEEFKKDDEECRAFAAQSVKDGNTAALKEGAISTATGAAIGAAAGALFQGGSSANVGTGAAIGMVGGAAVGAMGAASKESQAQTQYNTAYQQCMYTKGNQVPGFKPVNDYKLIK